MALLVAAGHIGTMNNAHHLPDRHITAATRATLARELSLYYGEQADRAPPFSLQRLLSSLAAGVPPTGAEADVIAAERQRAPATLPLFGCPVPWAALAQCRVLSASPTQDPRNGIGSGLLSPTETLPAVRALHPSSLFIGHGAQVFEEPEADQLILPRLVHSVWSTNFFTWVAETESVNQLDMQVSAMSMSARRVGGTFDVSKQLLKQSNADAILSRTLFDGFAEELDRALLGNATGLPGRGPIGLLGANTGVVNFPGASFNLGQLGDMIATAAAASADSRKMLWIVGSTAADIMMTRIGTGSTSTLWEHMRGTGIPVVATRRMKSDAVALVDPSAAVVAFFGSPQIETSEGGTRFNKATVGVRLLAFVDAGWLSYEGCSVTTDIT